MEDKQGLNWVVSLTIYKYCGLENVCRMIVLRRAKGFSGQGEQYHQMTRGQRESGVVKDLHCLFLLSN